MIELPVQVPIRQEGGTHSVEVKTSTRGVDVTVKGYYSQLSPPIAEQLHEVGEAVINEYLRILEEITARANA
jgi:hypothetical protein